MIARRKKNFFTKRWILSVVATAAFMVPLSFGLMAGNHTARADFNANNVMDDYVFENVNTMNAGQIDAFLNAFPGSCISPNNHFIAPDVTGYSPSGGYSYGGTVSAGTIIYHAAQAYEINPQVLLATLQKEQSVVTGGSSICSDSHAINAAMGYDCPDGGGCPAHASTTGFSSQIIHAAWLLRFGEERSEGNVNWAEIHGSWDNSDDPPSTYGGPMTQGDRARVRGGSVVYYDGYTTIDGQSVHMDTGATAALYWYTPHFHGNQSFDTIFQGWFGATTGQGFERVISSDTNDLRQWVVYGNIKQYIPDAQTIYAWNLENTPLVTIPSVQLGNIPTGPTLGRLAILNTGPPTIYFMDNGQRHKVPWDSLYDAWNFRGQVISAVTPGLFTQPSQGDDLTFSIKDPNSTDVYMPDGGNTSGQTVLRKYGSTALESAWEGASAGYSTVTSDYFSNIDNAIGATLTNTKITYGGFDYEVSGGWRQTMNAAVSPLYPGTAQTVSSATYFRLPWAGNMTQLVKSATNSTVYLMDGGTKHQIMSADALSAWSTPGQVMSVVNDSFMNQISAGTAVNGYMADTGSQLYVLAHQRMLVPTYAAQAYRSSSAVFSASSTLMYLYPGSPARLTSFVKSASSPAVYLLDASGQLHHINRSTTVDAWGGYVNGITVLSDAMINGMTVGADAGTFVTDGTTNYLLDNGRKWSVSGAVKADWNFGTPQSFTDGTLSQLPAMGALGNGAHTTDGGYFYVKSGTAYGTVDPNIAGVWNIANAPFMAPNTVTDQLPLRILSRYVQSNVNGDSRTFLVDNGKWYTVSGQNWANVSGGDYITSSMDPAWAPNAGSITDWTSVVVKDNANNYYVIDGGTKRTFANATVQNQWTNNGALGIPTVSGSFLNFLPTRGAVERAVKGTGPSIFSVEGGAKRHIRFADTYSASYAPYAQVTDTLLNVLPNGSDI
jgi:hypothetical protein